MVLRRVVLEAAIVLAAAAVVALWVIPSQTSSDAMARVQPAVLPLVCACAIAALALAMLITKLRRPTAIQHTAQASSSPHWRCLCTNTLIVALGIVALSWWGALAVPVAIIPLMMLYLGERRPQRIVLTVALIAMPLAWFGA